MVFSIFMNSNISFQSRINFVSPKEFSQIKIKNRSKFISWGEDSPLYVKNGIFDTVDIKTCTGGWFTDGVSKALGFHWLDDIKNYFCLDSMCDDVFNVFQNSDINGLIVGGKNLEYCQYSLKITDKVIDYFKKKVKHLTIFQEHNTIFGQTSYLYILKNNTCTICAEYTDKNGYYQNVQNLKDLKRCYKRIIVADNDVICFNGVEVPREKLKQFYRKSK